MTWESKGELATQVGMQRHEQPNFNRVKELIRNGAIGELKATYAWGNRQIPKPGYFPEEGTPPKGFHYDLWLGPAPFILTIRPTSPVEPAPNCLSWTHVFWDFGAGQIGDMGSHAMDLLWNAVDAAANLRRGQRRGLDSDVTPVNCESHFEHPANDWRGPITVSWYQGGAMPRSPKPSIDLTEIGHGAMFKGTKGFVVADFDSRMIIPFGDDADLSYYKPTQKGGPVRRCRQRQLPEAVVRRLQRPEQEDRLRLRLQLQHDRNDAPWPRCLPHGKKISYDGKTGTAPTPPRRTPS